jgi:hypothetical protein
VLTLCPPRASRLTVRLPPNRIGTLTLPEEQTAVGSVKGVSRNQAKAPCARVRALIFGARGWFPDQFSWAASYLSDGKESVDVPITAIAW